MYCVKFNVTLFVYKVDKFMHRCNFTLKSRGDQWRRQDLLLLAWRSGNALCRINEVALRRARLVLGWVTVYGQVNHLGMKPAS